MKKPVEKKKCFVHLTKKSTNLKGMSFLGSKVASFLTRDILIDVINIAR